DAIPMPFPGIGLLKRKDSQVSTETVADGVLRGAALPPWRLWPSAPTGVLAVGIDLRLRGHGVLSHRWRLFKRSQYHYSQQCVPRNRSVHRYFPRLAGASVGRSVGQSPSQASPWPSFSEPKSIPASTGKHSFTLVTLTPSSESW